MATAKKATKRVTYSDVTDVLDAKRIGFNDDDVDAAISYLNGTRTCGEFDKLEPWVRMIADEYSKFMRVGLNDMNTAFSDEARLKGWSPEVTLTQYKKLRVVMKKRFGAMVEDMPNADVVVDAQETLGMFR